MENKELMRISVFADGTVRTSYVDKEGKETVNERILEGQQAIAFAASLGLLGMSTAIFGKRPPEKCGEAVEVKKE